MSTDSFLILLDKIPLFALNPGTPLPTRLDKIYKDWPAEYENLITEAQQQRDLLVQHMQGQFSNLARISDIDKYLPTITNIEHIKLNNPSIKTNEKEKFHWKQSPLVREKFQQRSFNGEYIQNEILHLIFLKAILLLNQGSHDFNAGKLEVAASSLKQSAGIFQYLASDRCRNIDPSTAPIEMAPPIFNSLMSLCLGEMYSIIAAKGEKDGTSKSALGKVTYTSSTTFQTALDALHSYGPQNVIHQQYDFWLQQLIALFHGYSCAFFAFAQKQKEEVGMSIGLLRLAIKETQKVEKLYKKNELPQKAINSLIEQLQPYDSKWSEDNFIMACKPIADETTTNRFISTSALTNLNLPQPANYDPPEPTVDVNFSPKNE